MKIAALEEDRARKRARVILPAPALSEFLIPEPRSQHADLITTLHRRFQVAPFDVAAASKAACIWQEAQDCGAYPELCAEGLTRQVIKVDVQILAVALVQEASILYTEDPGIRRLAERVAIVSEQLRALPIPLSDKLGLFD